MQTRERLDALTTLRFFAASMIVLGHAHPIFGSFGIAQAMPVNQGVSFFFVLSGFILAWNYPVLDDTPSRVQFWWVRFARIWPLHAVTCLMWIVLVTPIEGGANFLDPKELTKLVTNLALLQVWVPYKVWSLSYNGVAWSISAEFFFYAMFPLLIALWPRRWHLVLLTQAVVVLLVLALTTVLALPGDDDYLGIGLLNLIYFNPLVRIFEFSVGIGLAFVVRRLKTANLPLTGGQWLVTEVFMLCLVGLALLAAANLVGVRQTLGASAAYYGGKEGLWFFWAGLIGVFSLSRGPLTRLLSGRIGVFLGEISFALYLCHALVIHYIQPYTELLRPYGLRGYGVFWLSCLLLSAALFIGIEGPCRQWILAARAGKKVSANLKASFKTPQILALLFLLLTVVTLAIWRPSTLVGLEPSAVNTLRNPGPGSLKVAPGTSFDGRYEIVAVRLEKTDAQTTMATVLLHTPVDLRAKEVLALHVNGAQGKMLAAFDRKLDAGESSIPANTYWAQHYALPSALLAQAQSLGFALYLDPNALIAGTGGERDWDGKRLILRLPDSRP